VTSRIAGCLLAVAALSALAGRQVPPQTREAAYRANNRGVAYLEQYDYASAVTHFERALTTAPDLATARLNLAIALFYTGSLERARREAEAARQALPERAHPHYLLGLIARDGDRTDDALAHFEAVRRLDAKDVGAAINIGQVHLQEGRYVEAREAFAIAIEAEPSNVTATYGLATALIRSGARDEGTSAMERFQRLRDSGYGITHARNYLEQGRYAEAIPSTGAERGLVDERVPDVTFRPAAIAIGDGRPGPFSVTLVDYDKDGDLDVVAGHSSGVMLLRRESGRFSDVTAAAGLEKVAAISALAGDYDNDGLTDLCLLTERGVALFRQASPGRFGKVTAQGLQYAHRAGAAAWLDADHDGDLDLYVGGAASAAPARLFRNNGNGTFADITEAARLALAAPVVAAVATDYDNRRDVDLLIGTADRAPLLFRNLRDGTFGEGAGAVGLARPGASGAIAAGDVNKDTFTDFFFASAQKDALALSDGRGSFASSSDLDSVRDARAAQFIDYDNDGLLDLVAIDDGGIRVVRNLGGRWMDVSTRATADNKQGMDPGVRSLAAGDLDGDGDVDLLTGGERLTIWNNEGGSRHHSVRAHLSARVSNRSAVGAKVEIRAGSLLQKLEVYSSSPAPAPADLVFGIGARPGIDVVRVLWPAGILQSELVEQPGLQSREARTIQIEELDRKPSSCPYLYTWNGKQFEFVTDFLGGGEMGYWLAPGLRNTPDPDEYVRIDATQLAARNGRYELRITNELEEALFLDRAQLVAIDHPAGLEVHPAEGMAAAPRPFKLYYAAEPKSVLAAADEHGHDVLDRVTAMDRRYPDDFPLERIRGYAAPHSLTLTLPPGDGRLLLLSGWTDYAFSGDNVAAHQASLPLSPPALEIKDSDGRWRVAIENIGFPVGRPQTVVVDLSDLSASVREVRISTSMRVYWDWVRVARARDLEEAALTRLEPVAADLRWRGFSAEVTPDGREPYSYDYQRVSPTSPWKLLPGRYTREGDVRELLARTDDMFVIARPGDDIALSFDARTLPPLGAGWTRTFLLYADGFSKEMDMNSSSPDVLAPLPFHGMTGYPYEAPEAYPSTDAHRDYANRYNTRIVPRMLPPLELTGGRR
jgi:Tfp pilus assembly protein PilF